MSHQFEINREVVLHATPEQVFAAVTSGTAGWMFPVESDPGVGAPGAGAPGVTAWDPPNHFAVRVEGEDGRFNALEYIIEARGGGTATLRYVHSGIFVGDWEDQYDGVGKHTDFYLHSLDQYVRYFPGRSVAYISLSGPVNSSGDDAFETLKSAVGLTADSGEGDAVRLELPGLDPIDAVIDYINPYFLGLRSDDALYRFYGRNAFGGTVDAAHHLFAEGIDAAKTEQAWHSWLDEVYA
jgi:hypothetical protein